MFQRFALRNHIGRALGRHSISMKVREERLCALAMQLPELRDVEFGSALSGPWQPAELSALEAVVQSRLLDGSSSWDELEQAAVFVAAHAPLL